LQRSRVAVALGAVLTALWLPAATGAREDAGRVESGIDLPPRAVDKHAKLDAALGRLADAKPGGRLVRIEAVARPGRRGELETAIRTAGGTMSGRYGPLVEARLPARALETLAAHPAARRLRAPARPQPQVVGEGIAKIGAAPWHSALTNGAGVEIAIVDIGFAGWQQLADVDLPEGQVVTKNFCGDFAFDGDDHGTAVAEIVHEVAPAAKLHLICVDTPTSLGEAKDYVVANDIPIVNHSVGWFNVSRGDGNGEPGTPDAIVADARADGVLWVNAAGNYAQVHWSGSFSDPDGDGWHNFAGSDLGNEVELAGDGCIFLKWDDWPLTDQDFDLFLKRTSDDVVFESSEGLQAGAEEPWEELCYFGLPLDDYYVSIFSDGATEPLRFDLFVTDADALEYSTSNGSLVEPATSPHALAVGAVCFHDLALRDYSSRGPTIDERVKPDVAGPDGVSTATYDSATACDAGFAGTSASTPHVAGVAALLKQANPGFGPAELQASLEAHTGPPAAKDNDVGAGIVALGGPPPAPVTAPANAALPAITGLTNQGQTLTAPDGVWTGGTPLFVTFRWLRCPAGAECVAIAGARGKTYVPTATDVGHTLKVRVRAANTGGSAQALSQATAQIQAPIQPPANVMAPSLAGIAQFGLTMSASSGAWSGPAPLTVTIEWLRCNSDGEACFPIAGAIGTSYQPALDDIGMTLRIRVTATNAGGSATERSVASAVVLPPVPGVVSPPSIEGIAAEGRTLTASPGTWTFASAFLFQWRRCAADGTCVDVPSATSATYAPGIADAGFRLQIAVTATNAAASSSATSALTSPVSRVVSHGVPPPNPRRGPLDVLERRTRLVVLGFTRSPQNPQAGTRFTLLVRVGVRATTTRGATRRVSCFAGIGQRVLRPVAKGLRGGVARCAWAIPKAAAGKRLRSTIVVSEGARSVRRNVTARIRGARLR
jgi:Subtilase family